MGGGGAVGAIYFKIFVIFAGTLQESICPNAGACVISIKSSQTLVLTI